MLVGAKLHDDYMYEYGSSFVVYKSLIYPEYQCPRCEMGQWSFPHRIP